MARVRSVLYIQRPAGDPVLQREPFQVLHGDKRLSVLLANVVNCADVWVIQGRRGLRLALEACQSLRVLANFVRQELQGDKTLETGVFGLVDHAHPTTTEFFENAVMRDCLFDHELSGAKKLLDDRARVPISQFVSESRAWVPHPLTKVSS